MDECPQFPLMPQIVPIYRPQQPPPPLSNAFPMSGQPIFPIPPQFAYPPMPWSPIHRQFPPPPLMQQPPASLTPQPAYGQTKDDDDPNIQLQHTYISNNNNNISSSSSCSNNNNNNNVTVEDMQNELLQQSQRPNIQMYPRNLSSKFDTRHEEFRKYLEEVGILSTFTNIIAEMYQDPLRPSDPLGYIRDKLNCSRPEMIELSNLRIWCDQYQTKTLRLEKELKHVIERLKKHEPYNSDDSLFNENSSDNDCQTCVLDITKQGHILEKKKKNSNYESF